MPEYATVRLTGEFVESLVGRDFSHNERHPSLRVYLLHGDQAGIWSASASDELRMTFERLPDGRKLMLLCSRHYQ
jgi:hypothetical protein